MQTLIEIFTNWQDDPEFKGLWVVPQPERQKKPFLVRRLDYNTTTHQFMLSFRAGTKTYMALLPDTGLKRLFDTHLVATTHTDQNVVVLNGQFYPHLKNREILTYKNPAASKQEIKGVIH